MSVWMVRGDKPGQHQATAIEQGFSYVGYGEMPNLAERQTREAMLETVRETYGDMNEASANSICSQLFAFAHRIEEGDIIAMPLRSQPQVALGRVTAPYEYRTDLGEVRHTRRVDWVRPDSPRSRFRQDLLYSLGA